eukprot:CAMPEP_0170516074 /NCGR_PEP_ID=MMETSP0209-20121228/2413_1 /TAXON_ID=665100 ORGANISM="Litonotus pictus, Strain P1" /NCGR_SAMPLE_ID=MMETSP0209 /ASSEMBLY_ACC=CAM_ASM_000301 /LENGTH=240 /DNA_ID=CAMNT_0010800847 /DNA_START=25 /DNA_END=747 /DNA_ORIENTATION=+
MALIQQKLKLKSAVKGKDLLKRKADALKMQFRQILKELIDKKKNLGNCYNDALIYLARANYSSSGEISRTVEENVKSKSDIKLSLKTKNHAGVICPEFSLRNMDDEKLSRDMEILGITGGGHTLNIAKKQFLEYLNLIVGIATLQTSYKAIDESLKITNRRVNALEYIVVPRIQFVMKYIDTELQERAKEDKFRIKKVLQNKKKHKEILEKLKESEQGEVVEEVNAFIQEEEDDDDEIIF